MEKLTFTTSINAPKEKVWETLWNDNTYREWTSVFSAGSHYKGKMEQGERIEFLDGKGAGMFSQIETLLPNAQMTFKHLGEIRDGKDVPMDWGDARESYFLSGQNGKTELRVELDVTGDFAKYFNETFPKALQLVKELAEK